jgi:enamine deaminase RidA (YjgF/YER057c/UK114 family)
MVALEYSADIMEKQIFKWLEREFVQLSGEGRQGAPAGDAINELFQHFEGELKTHGLSLENAVRVRVWGRDKHARTLATAARSKILTGDKRAASSSFISQEWFDSQAAAGLELLAMRPLDAAAARKPVDFEPARNYLYFLDFDGVIFFSGFTSEAAAFEQQVSEVLNTYAHAIARAQTDWNNVMKFSVLLQRGCDMAVVKRALAQAYPRQAAEVEFSFVDGFAGEKYLLEIEATALKGHRAG